MREYTNKNSSIEWRAINDTARTLIYTFAIDSQNRNILEYKPEKEIFGRRRFRKCLS